MFGRGAIYSLLVRLGAASLFRFPLNFIYSIDLGLLGAIRHAFPSQSGAEAAIPNIRKTRGIRVSATLGRTFDIHLQRCHRPPLDGCQPQRLI